MRILWLVLILGVAGCLQPFPSAPDADGDGYSVGDGDCDDADAELSPDTVWLADADADGFGDDDAAVTQCEAPAAHVRVGGDCDDADAAIRPEAPEVCDEVDQDCDGVVDDGTEGATFYLDADLDGYGAADSAITACTQPEGYIEDGADCDDADADVSPDAVEVCNGVDDDCDEEVDVGAIDATTWYDDVDGDGYGADASAALACEPLADQVDVAGDCDDGDAAYNPAAEEPDCADPNDYDCDGSVAYVDGDADGFAACEDCDDASSAIRPDADEICDGIDNDCDVDVDEAGALGELTWYFDGDADGYGSDAISALACAAPTGHVALGGDCDDDDDAFHPGADEADCSDPNDYDCDGSVAYADADGDGYAACDDCDDGDASASPGKVESCDGVDNDCDSVVDEADATDATAWYADVDGDGFGVSSSSIVACDAPVGHVAYAGDCDDGDVAYNPDADESDCADPSDYNCDGAVGYADSDGDGFAACEECDDTEAAIRPDADELCDAVDNDCDGAIDEADATDAPTWYVDADRDGYGAVATTQVQCSRPSGYVADSTDCNDASAAVNPGASEVCDTSDVDEDCDGDADDDDSAAIGKITTYADADADGYGSAADAGAAWCDVPSGRVTNKGDCDDSTSAVSPAGTELCDAGSVDEDCDGSADDADSGGASGKTSWYTDADADGYGAGTATVACDQPSGTAAASADCDDAVAAIHPGATEVCDGSDVDEDCDGKADDADPTATGKGTYYADADGDGYGSSAATGAGWCDPPSGLAASRTDCDDAAAAVNPGAAEACDAADTDEDCDGLADDADTGATGRTSWYADGDGDGYGAGAATSACDQPTGRVADATDCDDGSAAIKPGATEICDGADNDCDASIDEGVTTTFYRDADGDTYGALAVTAAACSAPTGYVADATDCDDADGFAYPSAPETCDAVDNDCDVAVDEDTWALDFDGVDDIVTLPALPASAAYTLEAWVHGAPSSAAPAALLGTSCGELYWSATGFAVVQFEGCDTLAAQHRNDAIPFVAWPSGWWHVALVATAPGAAEIYVDGASVGVIALTPAAADVAAHFGGVGAIELEAGVYAPADVSVGAARVSSTARYAAAFTPDVELAADADTVLRYSLDEGAGSLATDDAGAGLDGAIVGAAWLNDGAECL